MLSYFSRARQVYIQKDREGLLNQDNARPITITSPIVKWLDRIVDLRIKHNKNAVGIRKEQFGFVSGLGTMPLFIKFREEAERCIESYNREFAVLFIDFKSAFDSISQKRLIE